MGFRKGSKTKYKGVIKRKDKFEAQIRVNKKYYYLGVYDNEHEAALAYNEALDRFNLNREKTSLELTIESLNHYQITMYLKYK